MDKASRAVVARLWGETSWSIVAECIVFRSLCNLLPSNYIGRRLHLVLAAYRGVLDLFC